MNSIFFDELYNKRYIEEIDNDDFYEAAHEIVQDAQSEVAECDNKFKSLFRLVDNELSNAIDSLKKVKNEKIKIKCDISKAKEFISKGTTDMITGMNKYTKETKFGKGTFIAANILGWVPPFTPIPGATEMLYSTFEVANFLIEIRRVYTGANRSAINDFINVCKEQERELLDPKNVQIEISRNKFLNKIMTYVYKVMKTLTGIIQSIMLNMRSGIIQGYSNTVYPAVKQTGKALSAVGGKGSGPMSKKIQHVGENLERTGKELQSASKKSAEAMKRLKKLKRRDK